MGLRSKFMKNNRVIFFCFLLFSVGIFAQEFQVTMVHSHNDYNQDPPFWSAYSSGVNSLEVDVFLKNGVLYVTHDEGGIIQERTLEELYLKPLQEQYGTTKKIQDPREVQQLQILIDLKSKAAISLDVLVNLLSHYTELTSHHKLRFVISGNRPEPEKYSSYPGFIWFDHQDLSPISEQAMKKVAMISMNFRQFSSWDGNGEMTADEIEAIEHAINTAQKYQKPFRFWATPDDKSAWETFARLGVSYINTDQPYQCVQFVASLK